jgi:hypothetical protein
MSHHRGTLIGHIHRPAGKFVFVDKNGDIRALDPHRSSRSGSKKGKSRGSRKSRKKGSSRRGKKKSGRR